MILSPQQGLLRPEHSDRSGFLLLNESEFMQAAQQALLCHLIHITKRQPAAPYGKAHGVEGALHRYGINIAEQVFDQLQITQLKGIALVGMAIEIGCV